MLRPQQQLSRRNPELGIEGDCHRTAIAIIFGLDASEVPHFCDEGNDMLTALRLELEWLAERGLSHMHWTFPPGMTMEEVLEQTARVKDVPMILLGNGGRSNHSVVIMNGKLFCDPATGHADCRGLLGPPNDNEGVCDWWVTIFVVAKTFSDRNSSVPSIVSHC